MAKSVANVVVATDTFASWITKTNELADAMSVFAVTVQSNTTGATAVGNGSITGTFAANTVAVSTALRGGTVNASANLTVTSNARFTGGVLYSTANVDINAANAFVNATAVSVIGGALNITSNVAVTVANATVNATAFRIRAGSLNVDSTVSMTNTVSISNNLTIGGTSHTVAGNVAFDTSTLFIDAANNRVGFGNTTPDATVTITGTANISGATRAGNTTVVGFINTNSDATFGGIVNATALNIGANVNVTTTSFNIGNSTVNTALGQTSGVITGNSTIKGVVNSTAFTLGSNTANIAATSSTLVVSNASLSTALSVGGLTSGNTTSNIALTQTSIRIGNTTVNTIISGASISTNGTLAVTGASTLSNTLSVGGNFTLQTDVVLGVVSNTNIGSANTQVGNSAAFTSVNIFSFLKTDYIGAKITARIQSLGGANVQVQELILSQSLSDNTAILTVYGTVAAPPTANLGVFSTSINSTAVAVKFQPTGANSNVKLFTQLLK